MPVKLKNATGAVSKIGYLVSIAPNDPDSFVYTIPNSTKALGVVTEAVPYRKLCTIATIGDKADVYVSGNAVKGSIIRATKSGDRISLGACAIVKMADAPYLKIGETLQGGRGLVSCVLDLQYVGTESTGDFQPLDDDLTRLADYRRIGSDANYTSFDSTGHQNMTGTARPWRDELGDVTRLKIQGTGVSENVTENTIDFNTASNLSDYAYVNVQLNHDKDLTSSIYPHLHWFQAENHIPNFLLQYRWQVNGVAKTAGWTNLICITNQHAYTAGTINQISYAAPITVPANTDMSDMVQFRILRDNANGSGAFSGADTYTATVSITSFDCHFMTNSLGSNEEYVK